MNRRLRQGFTLIELIAVVGAVTIIMAAATMMMYMVFDLAARQRERTDSLNAQERLLDTFRSDVKAFGVPEVVERKNPGQTHVILRWKTKDVTVDYQRSSTDQKEIAIHRIETKSGQVALHETFTIENDVRVEYYQGTGDNRDLIALSLWKSPPYTTLNKSDLDPFTGKISESLEKQVDPRYAGNWRTAIVRIANRSK